LEYRLYEYFGMIDLSLNGWVPMDDIEAVKQQLAELMAEHRDLDEIIERLIHEKPFDQIQVQRLKKRKLALKDKISSLEDMLVPDIIA